MGLVTPTDLEKTPITYGKQTILKLQSGKEVILSGYIGLDQNSYNKLLELLRLGMSDNAMAKELDIDPDTVSNWCQIKNPWIHLEISGAELEGIVYISKRKVKELAQHDNPNVAGLNARWSLEHLNTEFNQEKLKSGNNKLEINFIVPRPIANTTNTKKVKGKDKGTQSLVLEGEVVKKD